MKLDIRSIDRTQAMPFMLKASRFDCGGTLDDVPGAAYMGIFDEMDALVGAYMIHLDKDVYGQALHIRAASGLQMAGVDWVAIGLTAVRAQAQSAGIARVKFTTRRRALVRQASRHGFKVDGYTLSSEV